MKENTGGSHKSRMLTDVELELMTILWRIGEGSVASVIAELPEDRKLAYTSVSTMLRILEQKQILKTRKEGRGHIYIPLLSKADYEVKTVRHVIDNVFQGAPAALIRTLLDAVSLLKLHYFQLSSQTVHNQKGLIFNKKIQIGLDLCK